GNNGGSSVTGLTVQGAGAAVVNVGREEFVETLANDMTGEVIINDHFARLTGAVNLSSLAGGATMNVTHGGAWELSNSTSLTSDEDALFVGEGGFVHTSIWGSSSNPGPVHTLNFGDGDDTLTNEGRILVGVELMNGASAGAIDSYGTTPRDRYEAELILLGLETFENHGEIWMGTSFSRGGGAYSGELVPILGDPNKVWYARGTDRAVDDIVTMPGTTFIGGESGRIFMDINLNYLGSAQSGCDTSFRDAGGNLPAADCINLQNGATEGTIVLSLTSIAAGGRGAFNPNGIVVIDMSDGEGGPGSGAGGAAGQVTLSPEMRFYNPNFGGVLDTGMFMAMPVYDEELMQFKIVGAPSGGAFHQPLMVNGAQQAWRSANASYFERQADLRDTLRAGEERSTGLWMRAGYEKGERDPDHVFSLASGDLTYDNAHDLNVASLTVGGDFLGSSDGENYWVLGGLLGYVRTDIEYQSWTDATSMNGVLLGGYASLVEGPLFIDASLSGLWNRADQILPQAELFRDATLKTDINTLGVQAEAGWRFDLGLARIEPLVNASWARTRPRDFKVPEDDPVGPGNQVMFEEATSARAGVGLRGSTVVTNSSGMRSSLSLTGRYSREFDGEASAAIGNLNPISPVVTDDFGGDFGEVIGGLTVADATGRLSGALNLGTRFGEDYEALTASASFRYQW
ncbi:MAG TPA: autotransporter outer membrane beta-barrel domain-containing protein, partial [Caulobacteraceae bacterium]|nr:autotransporter outer membrane beta-barrel domain-containing protein [Caulobacteraceae bacterium]